ncbi:MAG: helix-turn-helix transcriptional regulator [Lachnospiraceae bacterium]|nr:helix-turn-helix transcriptional regulator [Lachnospiraceae bacterium]
MTISDRIFEKLRQVNMTQKEFSEQTGISQSTISEWKSKRTNPTSEKIMLICKVLDVTPEWLLSGIENTGERGNNASWYVIDKETDMGILIKNYHEMSEKQRDRLIGYMEALMAMPGEK